MSAVFAHHTPSLEEKNKIESHETYLEHKKNERTIISEQSRKQEHCEILEQWYACIRVVPPPPPRKRGAGAGVGIGMCCGGRTPCVENIKMK